jgi:CMP-N-acetylneuraminic acid synthetase
MKDYVIIIPAKGTSRRIKKKNLFLINKRPLFVWSLLAGLKTGFENVYVSTESEEVKFYTSLHKGRVLSRPIDLCQDDTTTEEVLLFHLEKMNTKNVILIQPTSPLLTSQEILNGIKTFEKGNYDSLFSACEIDDFLFWDTKKKKPINYCLNKRMNLSKRKSFILETGAFYIFNKKSFMKKKNRLFGNIGYSLMERYHSFEVDTEKDLNLVGELLK